MKASTRWLLAMGWSLAVCGTALGQDAAPADGVAPRSEPAPARRKPKPKVTRKTDTEPAPKLRTGGSSGPGPSEADPAPAEPIKGMAATRPATRAPTTLSIVCDPGQAVRYAQGSGSAIWVTRSGRITVDNPLRPLTPDVTRVLLLVIGDRTATAYGGDFLALKRGASPAALEGTLGGSIHWDGVLPTLPDALNIVADSGASLIELPFQSCGQAPATRAAPVAKAQSSGKTEGSVTPSAAPSRRAPTPATADGPLAPKAPRRTVTMPRGAISE